MRARMRRIVAIVLMAVACAAAAALPEGHDQLPSGEWKAIQQVIGDQLKALKAGDGTKAITYSAPGIRQQFRTPERFLRMVREGYSALLDARSSTFLEGAVIGGETIQPLQLVLPDNTVVVALYTMVKVRDGQKEGLRDGQRGGNWRIAGCVIAPSKSQST